MAARVLTFNNRSDRVFVCDMRPGFTEDGIDCALPRGEYEVTFDEAATNDGRGFRMTLNGATPDEAREIGLVSVDMALVGIFDRKAFLDYFNGDFEQLYDWSSFAVDADTDGAVEISPDDCSDLNALVAIVGCDGTYRVEQLVSGSSTVGLAVTHSTAEGKETSTQSDSREQRPRQWTRITIKLAGVGEPLCFVDDLECDAMTLDEVLADLILEVELDLENQGVRYDEVDPNKALKQYMPRIRGFEPVRAFLDTEGRERGRRISLPKSIGAAGLAASATFRDISELVLAVTLHVRNNTDRK